jgi:hypothetical protein
MRDDCQDAGAGVGQEIVLQGGAGGEEPGGGQPIAPDGEGRRRSGPWLAGLPWEEKGKRRKGEKDFGDFLQGGDGPPHLSEIFIGKFLVAQASRLCLV